MRHCSLMTNASVNTAVALMPLSISSGRSIADRSGCAAICWATASRCDKRAPSLSCRCSRAAAITSSRSGTQGSRPPSSGYTEPWICCKASPCIGGMEPLFKLAFKGRRLRPLATALPGSSVLLLRSWFRSPPARRLHLLNPISLILEIIRPVDGVDNSGIPLI